MTPTRDERINATARVEYFYRYDHPSHPVERPTCVDREGYSVWLGTYEDLREDGLDHETAIRAVEQGMRQASGLEPIPVPTTHPIAGQLRISGMSFVDDKGLVLPALAHFGEAFSAWAHGRVDDVKRQLDVIMGADYHGVRSWDTLGYYSGGWGGREVAPIAFTNDRGTRIPATPGYYDKLQRFLESLKERSLVLHHSRGDLNSWAKPAILNHCATVGQVQRAVGLSVIALNESVNEAQLNIGDWSAAFLDEMRKAINNPSVIEALSDVSQNEDTDTLVTYARDCVYVHGYRGGDADPVGQLRHVHSLRYDGAVKVAGKVGWQGEPHGHNMSGPSYTRADTMTLNAMQAWCCRQAWVWTGRNGVFWDGPIEAEPAFREVPKARHWLPQDCMSYTDAFHGGATWAGKRTLRADYPDGRLRADHRQFGKQITITVHAKPGQQWKLPVERAFTGHVIDPIHGPGDEQTWQVGQTFDFDGRDRTGVLVVGQLL